MDADESYESTVAVAAKLHTTRSRAWKPNDDAVMSSALKPKSKQRDPPPALFLHPSPAASHVSLPGILAPGATSLVASPRDRNTLGPTGARRGGSIAASHPRSPGRLPTTESARSADRTDARWAEMQTTLEEVELSATGGTHVFGAGHDEKLAELRKAQIALAQAWTRSEADDTIAASLGGGIGTSSAGAELRNLKGALGDASKSGHGDGTDAPKSTAASNSARPGSSGPGVERLGAKLEEETESDILLARKRREANDQYFQRVNNGVLDVVRKLEDVAVAMRAVEQESKEVWDGDGDHEEANSAQSSRT